MKDLAASPHEAQEHHTSDTKATTSPVSSPGLLTVPGANDLGPAAN